MKAFNEKIYSNVKKKTHKLIGIIGLYDVNYIGHAAHLSITIGEKKDRGKGLGTEAIKTLLKWAFDELNLHSICLYVFSFNTLAIQCYQNIGFKVIGTKRETYFTEGKYYDEILMDILRTDLKE